MIILALVGVWDVEISPFLRGAHAVTDKILYFLELVSLLLEFGRDIG